MEIRVVEVEDGIENNRMMITVRIEMRDGGDICGYRGQRTGKCASLKLLIIFLRVLINVYGKIV